jgi:hypothetical protein
MKFVIATLLLLSLIAISIADIPAIQAPETQGFSSATNIVADGLVTESDTIVWQGSTHALDDSLAGPVTATPWDDSLAGLWFTTYEIPDYGYWILGVGEGTPGIPVSGGDVFFWEVDPANNTPGEVQFTTSYREDTLADSGQVTYTKSLSVDTRNQVANQENVEAEKIVAYVGDETGLIYSTESLLLDTAGQYGWSGDLFLCPFASGIPDVTPQFCTIAEMGSIAGMKQMTMTTSAGDRFIAATGDVPISLDYDITVSGVEDSPAIGGITAYIQVHSMEGRMMEMWDMGSFVPEFDWGSSYRPGLASDLVYREETTASGAISGFGKQMSYTSGYTRIP